MSLGILPEFNPELPSVCFEADGCGIVQFADELDSLAGRLGLRPLSSFGDQRPVPPDFAGPPWELDEVLGPWTEWFSADEGLAVVSGLRCAFQKNSAVFGDASDVEWVLLDLKALEDALHAAASAGAKFRLAIVS